MFEPCARCHTPTLPTVLDDDGVCRSCNRELNEAADTPEAVIEIAREQAHERTRTLGRATRAEINGARAQMGLPPAPPPQAPAVPPAVPPAEPPAVPPAPPASKTEMVNAELARRVLARKRLLPFVIRFNPAYMAGWLHRRICEELEWFEAEVVAKRSPRLILATPPRSGKSELVSRCFPAWFLGRNPQMEVIAASHTASLAMDFSRKARSIVRSQTFTTVFADATLDPDTQAAEHWRTAQGGGYTAVGVGSAVVGKGAHCIAPFCNVATPHGPVPIIAIRPGDIVLGYDHTTRTVRPTHVIAVSARPSDAERTRMGGLECTADHRVFVPAAGYTEARLLTPADEVLELASDLWRVRRRRVGDLEAGAGHNPGHADIRPRRRLHPDDQLELPFGDAAPTAAAAEEPVREMRGAVRGERDALPAVLRERGVDGDPGVHPVRDAVPAVGVRGAAEPEGGADEERVLLPGLLPHIAANTVVDLQTDTQNFFAGGILVHNCLLIDDPVAGAEDADSFKQREAVRSWFQTEAYTRLAPGGGVLIIMQRWHDDDLAGWLERQARENDGEPYRVVRFPAIAVEDEPYRKAGEALHPERYPLEALERIKRNMTIRQWEALYQQNPVPDDGTYFTNEMFWYYEPEDMPPVSTMNVYMTWDLAIGTNEQNDYTAAFIFGVGRDDTIYILDHIHGRFPAMEIVERLLDAQKLHNAQIAGIEKGHIQMTLGPFLSKRMAERKQLGFLLHPMQVGRRDKQARARSIQGRMQQGRVRWPRRAPWLPAVLRELLMFPNGTNDDRADALAYVGLLLDEMVPTREPLPLAKRGWREKVGKLKTLTTRSAMSA